MNIQDALQTLGLSDKQVAVYLALLQLGQSTSYRVATKAGLKKPTTYIILDELIEKSLVIKVPKTKVQQYVARTPEEAFAKASQNLAQAKALLPEILALTKGQKHKVNALYFEGIEGIRQLLEYKSKEHAGQEMLAFWATDKNITPALVEYFQKEWFPTLQRQQIRVRGVAPADPLLTKYRTTDAQYGHVVKSIPVNEYHPEVALSILGDLVRIEDYKNLQGLAIENEDVAKALRQIFEIVWKKY